MANLQRIHAIEALRGGISQGASIAEIRRLASVAYDDEDRGRRYAMEVYRARQAAGMEEW